MISRTSTNTMLSFKVVLISTSVLSAAIMMAITDFHVYLPSIYNGVVSWLRPPYLYLVINFIVVTILVSSKLQSNKDEVSPSPSPNTLMTTPLDTMGFVPPQPVAALAAVKTTQPEYYAAAAECKYNGVVLDDAYGRVDNAIRGSTRNEQAPPLVVNAAAFITEDATSNKENECVIAKSKWTAPENKELSENSPSNVKPPVSARFGHRRNVKASPEGGKTVLGVSKPKKQDTLESTWKTITEGRAVPITRHLRKSDTWERDGRGHGGGSRRQLEKTTPPAKTMTKAETFNERTNTRSPSPGSSNGSGGSGKLKREASLGQDELNRRVEAFIKKFNEEMRLQRQESLNQYMQMVNRGSH